MNIFVVCVMVFLFGSMYTFSSIINPKGFMIEMDFIFPVNENGETYGENIFEDALPDLIAAIGDDGTEGYVREGDLRGENFKTPEEALQHIPKTKILLYEKDGKTILGEFTLNTSH
ncbi:hypothetical protein RBU61_05110 [Tissierella sp. MB52-C2]|uniref:hypothetical protein n=1 Tax=Tissierella sp. MB52-C2 TaxID=3070999 RepID=UPI00280A9F8D|nr:hypothetical protein [Tissierella sp. MB52-C2]WMM26057.1 hypothetical protein RBU61_05110 [Tissierella sp. MB52-C2]